MRVIVIISTLALVIGALVAPSASASNTIAAREGLACTKCHDKPGSKLLTDRGKYYELMSSLEGYDEIQATFGKCTACHVRKPGSAKLTRKGRQFQWMVQDMEGLKRLLLTEHPVGIDLREERLPEPSGASKPPPKGGEQRD